MSFQVEVTKLPSHAGNFADLRDYVGKPALAIRHPDGPWTYALYNTPLGSIVGRPLADTKLSIIDTYEVGGVTITLAETIVKGTTAQHGILEEWEKPAVAYSADSPLSEWGYEGGTLYIFPVAPAQ